MKIIVILTIMSILGLCRCFGNIKYNVLKRIPHEDSLFTQGIQYYKGVLVESAGLYGKSSLQKIDSSTGAILQRVTVDHDIFAEGIVVIDDIIYMLTWRERKVLLFHFSNLSIIGSIAFTSHNSEGWGLTTNNDKQLVVSDGSNFITLFALPTLINDSDNIFKIVEKELVKVREFPVLLHHSNKAVKHINELEYITAQEFELHFGSPHVSNIIDHQGDSARGGYIVGNIWYQDELVVIDEVTGYIERVVDLKELYPITERPRTADCMNGIAYDKQRNMFLLTGKQWPLYFEVQFHPKS